MTATQDAPPPLSPDITVQPVRPRGKRAPFPISLYQSAVGKKWVMAITGLGLMGFVFAHMIGNLHLYQGQVAYDEYAAGLRTMFEPILPYGYFLWIMRAGLMTFFILHLHAAYSLTMMNKRARGPKAKPATKRDYIAANFASTSMRLSGIWMLLFIGFHIAELTLGKVAAPGYVEGDVYQNVVNVFNQPLVSMFYIASMAVLALHLFHGAWSIFQSLGINNPRFNRARKYFAIGFAVIVCGINVTFPLAVLANVVS